MVVAVELSLGLVHLFFHVVYDGWRNFFLAISYIKFILPNITAFYPITLILIDDIIHTSHLSIL